MELKVKILLIISLIIGFLIFYQFVGLPIAIIFLIIWFDKVLLAQLKIHGEFGIELLTIPIVLIGVIYGPMFGFIFGFLILAVLTGFLDLISWVISPPDQIGWLPFAPSPDTFKEGVTAVIAGFLWPLGIPLIVIVLLCSIFKNSFDAFKDKLIGELPLKLSRPLNIIFNLALVILLQKYLFTIIAL